MFKMRQLWIKRRENGRGKWVGGSCEQRGRSKTCCWVEEETKADDQMSMDQSSSLQPRSAARGGVAWSGKKSRSGSGSASVSGLFSGSRSGSVSVSVSSSTCGSGLVLVLNLCLHLTVILVWLMQLKCWTVSELDVKWLFLSFSPPYYSD